jgi:hypothetical protein
MQMPTESFLQCMPNYLHPSTWFQPRGGGQVCRVSSVPSGSSTMRRARLLRRDLRRRAVWNMVIPVPHMHGQLVQSVYSTMCTQEPRYMQPNIRKKCMHKSVAHHKGTKRTPASLQARAVQREILTRCNATPKPGIRCRDCTVPNQRCFD